MDLESKMSSAVLHFEKELNSLRTSRANPSMLDNIFAEAYGSKTPLNQLGNISVQDANTITIQVWDSSLIKSIENAITESNLGISIPSYRNDVTREADVIEEILRVFGYNNIESSKKINQFISKQNAYL